MTTLTTSDISTEELKDLIPNPIDVMKSLDEYIVGQTDAKKVLSVAMMHRSVSRLSHYGLLSLDAKIDKSNVLLIGPTGTGKTALMKALTEIMKTPITIQDVTSITSAGYIGGKVEDILINHVINCEDYVRDKYNDIVAGFNLYEDFPDGIANRDRLLMDSIQNGIIYLDEIDKAKINFGTTGRDVNGQAVQSELLKIIEEGTVDLTSAKRDGKQSHTGIRQVTTDNILYICGGAFSGLDDIVLDRLSKKGGIGFTSDLHSLDTMKSNGDIMKYVTNEDLIAYGIMPELLGRLPLRTSLDRLTQDMMVDIITKPKNNVLSQYIETFRVFGIDLKIEKDALKALADQAIDLKIGARSLKTIFSQLLTDELFNIFEYKKKKFTITKSFVLERGRNE